MAKKIIEKQILRMGMWHHPNAPNGEFKIDKDFCSKIVQNYSVTPFAPVLRGHVENKDAEANPYLIVSKNILGLEARDDGLWGKMELDETELEKYNDVSARIKPAYVDRETGKDIGPVLEHVALVLNPFIKKLKPFAEINASENNSYIINLSDISNMSEEDKKETTTVEKEDVNTEKATETVAEKAEEKTEVTEKKEEPQAESTTVENEKKETSLSDTNQDKSTDVLLAEYSEKIKELEQQVNMQSAEREFDGLLRDGKILPSQKNEFISLSMISEKVIDLSDNESKSVGELLKSFFAKAPKVINFSEEGVNVEEGVNNSELPSRVVKELRARRPRLSDEEFASWLEKNKETYIKALKKNK